MTVADIVRAVKAATIDLEIELRILHLRDHLRLKSAQEIAAEGHNSYSESSGWGMFAMPLVEFVAGNLRKPLAILLAAVATVLLIACANIAGLLLARATGRQHEVSIQIALGAGNARLIQQALLESLVLAVVIVAISTGAAISRALSRAASSGTFSPKWRFRARDRLKPTPTETT